MSLLTDMKSTATVPRAREYRMVARAESAARTHQRVLEAAFALYSENDFDDVSLDDVAERAGVTVRTVLRRFGTKEALVDAVADFADEAIENQRNEVLPGDATAAVRRVVLDYERYGDAIMRLLSQEGRAAAFRRIANRGRALHYAWVERTFEPQLSRRRGASRSRLLAELIAITDVYTWKLLRRDLGLSRQVTVAALDEMVAGITTRKPTRRS
jgi:AcrR family transcriptional regulator